MAKQFPWRCEGRNVEIMIGILCHDQLDRDALARLARYAPIVAALGEIASLFRGRPVIELANHDQCRHRHVILEAEAGRIEADSRTEFFFCASLDLAAQKKNS